MSTRARSYLRQNVLGLIAIFIALGGTAYAANTIGSDDIIDESILSQDIKNAQVTSGDLRANAVVSGDVRNDTTSGGGLTAPDLAADSVGSSEIAPFSVTTGDLSDNAVTADKLGALPAARMHKSTHSQGTTGSQNAVVVFSVEDFDTGGLVTLATSNSLLTAQRAGTYMLSGGIEWASNPNGIRMASLKVNTTTVASSLAPAGATAGNLSNVSTIVRLEPGDTVTMEALQNSGGGLSINPGNRTYLAAAFVGG